MSARHLFSTVLLAMATATLPSAVTLAAAHAAAPAAATGAAPAWVAASNLNADQVLQAQGKFAIGQAACTRSACDTAT